MHLARTRHNGSASASRTFTTRTVTSMAAASIMRASHFTPRYASRCSATISARRLRYEVLLDAERKPQCPRAKRTPLRRSAFSGTEWGEQGPQACASRALSSASYGRSANASLALSRVPSPPTLANPGSSTNQASSTVVVADEPNDDTQVRVRVVAKGWRVASLSHSPASVRAVRRVFLRRRARTSCSC
jgi:hypothetical protein